MFDKGMYQKGDDRLERAGALLAKGASLRQVSSATGMAKGTVAKLRKVLMLAAGINPRCPCGQLAGHRGWCSHRYANSPARQEVIARLHDKKSRADDRTGADGTTAEAGAVALSDLSLRL